jgi:hypothetical protein
MLRILTRLLVLGAFVSHANATPLFNTDFETGDFTGWTQAGWFIDTSLPNSGSYDASTGCSGAGCTMPGDPNAAYLYQDIATDFGANYTLSFFYNSGQLPTQGSELLVQWGDSAAPSLLTVTDVTNVDTLGSYVRYSGTVSATSALSRLEFFGRQDFDFYYLDDVALTENVAGAPEPGSLWLVAAGPVLLVFRKSFGMFHGGQKNG